MRSLELVESQRLPVWASPPTGGSRIGFPENHAAFQGMLPPAVGLLGQTLAGLVQVDVVPGMAGA